MGSVGDALDNAVAESFFAALQTEQLDRRDRWDNRRSRPRRVRLHRVLLQPGRRHSSIGYLNPADYDRTHRLAATPAA